MMRKQNEVWKAVIWNVSDWYRPSSSLIKRFYRMLVVGHNSYPIQWHRPVPFDESHPRVHARCVEENAIGRNDDDHTRRRRHRPDHENWIVHYHDDARTRTTTKRRKRKKKR